MKTAPDQNEPVPSLDTLPYTVHTNRELGMMLRGEKPLAVFTDVHDQFPLCVRRYLRLFDRHVAAGRFVRKAHNWSARDGSAELLTILYALPEEAWRMSRMIDLMQSEAWSRAHERQQGSLLGYTDQQNDVWLNRFYPNG